MLPFDQLLLERTGPSEATVGMISLPLPKAPQGLRIDNESVAAVPVGWWRRHRLPRRVVSYVLDGAGVPETLRLTDKPLPRSRLSKAWRVHSRNTFERLDFTHHDFRDVEELRGFPAEECVAVESEVLLTFGDRTLGLRIAATGSGCGGVYDWQNVQIDPQWENPVAQAFRIGGIMYNSDTYLWADVYLVLFANGVADVAIHLINTKLHIKGYDFRGLPLIRLSGDAVRPARATLPADGDHLTLGELKLNFADARLLVSEDCPGRIEPDGEGVVWHPISRTFNPQIKDAPPDEWAPGFARTIRFQFSLSDAPPLIARYRVPNWWYALCGEGLPNQFLPVRGRLGGQVEDTIDRVRRGMVRGRFDAGSAGAANDGDAGTGLMKNYYHTGRPELFRDALAHCYYWADLAVDHCDHTVHQWIGGWPWKTCAYAKFRDVLFGYLETADPYLLDVAEACADSYWQWFRSNWPRCNLGRDTFSVGAWALMWRYFDTEAARERCTEFVRMIRTVLTAHEKIGGQMGAGPHPGYHSALYMTGVCMNSLIDVAEAQAQMIPKPLINDIPDLLDRLGKHFLRRDVVIFPSDHGRPPKRWGGGLDWLMLACRAFPHLARLQGGGGNGTVGAGLRRLRRCLEMCEAPRRLHNSSLRLGRLGRLGVALNYPLDHDALMLGAQWNGEGVRLEPIGPPESWPDTQIVYTPLGDLAVRLERRSDASVLHFDAAARFPVEVSLGDSAKRTFSRGRLVLRPFESKSLDKPQSADSGV